MMMAAAPLPRAPPPARIKRDCRAAAKRSSSAAFVSVAAALAVQLSPMSMSQAYAADLALGETVFNGNCAACHLGGRNSVIPDHTLDKAAIEKYLDGGFSIEAIVNQVENGKGAMPAWADRLSEEEIQAVAAYVYNQANTAAWKF